MSHKATNWAVSQRGISPVAKVLLWQLADRHNPDNGCFPDQDTLARDCEISRATVNRNLLDLERVGLVKRVVRHHPVTNRRIPTRYYLAFEDEFSAIVGDREPDEPDSAQSDSHVADCDMAIEPSHVSPASETMSHQSAEPCLTGETHNQSGTSKLTSNSTGKRAGRAERESDFKKIWKLFPTHPTSSDVKAWDAFERLDDADAALCVRGVEHYASHFREDGPTSGKTAEERLRYTPHLWKWISQQGWREALRRPTKVQNEAEAMKVLENMVTINKFGEPALFAICERLRGRPAPVGASGNWSFDKDLVAQARRQQEAGTGPP
jgi:hypothetical protein